MTNLLASLVLALATTQHSPEPAQQPRDFSRPI